MGILSPPLVAPSFGSSLRGNVAGGFHHVLKQGRADGEEVVADVCCWYSRGPARRPSPGSPRADHGPFGPLCDLIGVIKHSNMSLWLAFSGRRILFSGS